VFVAIVNLFITAGYGRWAWTLLSLAARNRTVLRPRDDRYDVGVYANLSQILGERVALWLLPLPGTETAFDGLDFELNPHPKELQTEEEAADEEEAAVNDTSVKAIKTFRRTRRHLD